jgi:hypothetical protein
LLDSKSGGVVAARDLSAIAFESDFEICVAAMRQSWDRDIQIATMEMREWKW